MLRLSLKKLGKLILIAATVLTLLISNEPLSLFVGLIWVALGLFKLFTVAAKGGAFD